MFSEKKVGEFLKELRIEKNNIRELSLADAK